MIQKYIFVFLILLGGLNAGPSGRIPFHITGSTFRDVKHQCILLNDWISKSPEIHFDLPTTGELLRLHALSLELIYELEKGVEVDLKKRIEVINHRIDAFNSFHVRLSSGSQKEGRVNQYYLWSSTRSASSGNS